MSFEWKIHNYKSFNRKNGNEPRKKMSKYLFDLLYKHDN